MGAKPILFSGPMVRALLDGRKTQTRRIAKPQPEVRESGAFTWEAGRGAQCEGVAGTHWPPHDFILRQMCPFGFPGEYLWVKERLARGRHSWIYIADGAEVGWPARSLLAGKRLDYAPSIHMPKVASRLTLRITDVRIERLQDISEADAMAEGAEPCANGVWFDRSPVLAGSDARGGYYALWEHINGKGAWDANPWVWAVSFEVLRLNIEQVSAVSVIQSASAGSDASVVEREGSRESPSSLSSNQQKEG